MELCQRHYESDVGAFRLAGYTVGIISACTQADRLPVVRYNQTGLYTVSVTPVETFKNI